jgi:hypothetical protein
MPSSFETGHGYINLPHSGYFQIFHNNLPGFSFYKRIEQYLPKKEGTSFIFLLPG